jgi:tellurite resistance protein TerC
MRAIMITAGAALIKQYGWIVILFGVFLIFTGIKMFLQREEEPDPSKSPLLGFLRRRMRVTNDYDGQKFFTYIDGKRYATPLFLTLVFVEFTDLIFAVDSIPAIFSITTDPFIVFTSNIFAILGLRALYFLLAGVMDLFRFLKVGLAVILVFVGVKMLLGHMGIKIHPGVSLGVITCILAASISVSLLLPQNGKRQEEVPSRLPDATEPIALTETSKKVHG